MPGLYTSSLAAFEETPQSFVPERLDHLTKCSLLRIAQQADSDNVGVSIAVIALYCIAAPDLIASNLLNDTSSTPLLARSGKRRSKTSRVSG